MAYSQELQDIGLKQESYNNNFRDVNQEENDCEVTAGGEIYKKKHIKYKKKAIIKNYEIQNILNKNIYLNGKKIII